MTNEQLRILVQATQELSLSRDLDSIMKVVRTAARQLTGADGATFVLKDNGMCYYAEEDAISPLWKGQRFPLSACISGWAMLNKQHAAIEDIYADERIPADAYRPTFVKSLAMVPVRKMDPIAAIGNYWATKHAPTPDEIELLQSLADITSVAIENVYVYTELEERVKKRTAQLEEANDELDSFSRSVSHDLRAPVRWIQGYASAVQEDYKEKLDADGNRMLNNIVQSATRMDTLINDLLSFARMGREHVKCVDLDMTELTTGVIQEIERSVKHQAEIKVDQLHTISADYSLMRQVMLNLISNAVKFSSKKQHPKIRISSEEKDGEILFTVTDNGTGFDPRFADKLFQSFSRLHSQTEFEGTGVGLALVKRIISKHGGHVWAESKVGEGATFRFSIRK